MLDAAHGDTVRASEPPKRAHAFRPEVERAGVEIAGRKRRRKPPMPARTDSIQDSRLTGAEARKRAPQAAPEIIHNAFSCKTFARAGCGGRISDASRPRAQGLPYQKEPAGHACHNCHSERSGSTNAASAEAACGLCRARRRKTNEVQSRIYEGQSGIRFFVDLPISSE